MNKRKADRAAMRINIREKYGLKESKMDKELVQKSSKAQVEKKSSLEKKISLEKKDRLTRQKEMARRYNISPKKEKEKCSIMWETDLIENTECWWQLGSGIARAFPGGRLTHPKGQNKEENK